MNDIFAIIYETLFQLYEAKYSLIFDTLYENGGYLLLGYSFIIIPLLFWVWFYFFWNNPYLKLWHWFIWLLVTVLIVSGVSWGIANTKIFATINQSLIDALSDPESGYEQYAKTIVLNYAIVNGVLAIFTGIIYSLIIKRWSKLYIHLPF